MIILRDLIFICMAFLVINAIKLLLEKHKGIVTVRTILYFIFSLDLTIFIGIVIFILKI